MSGKRKNKGGRTARKQPTQLNMNVYQPMKAKCSADPPPVESSIRVLKRIQITLPYDTTSLGDVSMSVLMAGVPGGLTYWNRARLEKVDIWSNSSSTGTDTLTVLLPGVDEWSQPPVSFVDTGTYGNRRACVSFKLGLLNRARWLSVADTTVLFTAKADGQASGLLVVQATIELLSGAL